VKELRGDRQIQCDVLVALAECRNHRKWFADFARPYLGDHPIEIGSGLGDYAREWIPLTEHFTVTDADESLVIGLKKEMAGHSNVDVRQVLLPSTARAALTEAGLEVIDVRYANSLGLLCYYAFTSLLRKQPSKGVTMTFYDRRLVPVVRFAERLIKRPPFGQSVIAVARVRSPLGAAASPLSPEADPETGR
jgi:hypothetical protein